MVAPVVNSAAAAAAAAAAGVVVALALAVAVDDTSSYLLFVIVASMTGKRSDELPSWGLTGLIESSFKPRDDSKAPTSG